MAAIIQLPDGVYAFIGDGGWRCPDRKAIPVLEYFTARVTGDIYTNPADQIARQVAAMIVGAKFIRSDPTEPLPPGAIS